MVAIRRAAIAGVGLVLAYLVVATALWNDGRSTESIGLPNVLADDPDIVMQRALSEFDRSQGKLGAQTYSAVLDAARLDPAEDEPLLFAAMRPENKARKGELLEAARMRNPRLASTRIVLLDRYLETGDGAAAAREIGALSRLMPGQDQALTALLEQVASHPETRSEALKALPENPLLPSLLMNLTNHGASPFQILDIARHMKGAATDETKSRWITNVISRFASRGDLEGARRLWMHFYAIDSTNSASLVFDPGFEGIGGPPFGWDVSQGSAGFAEIRDNALWVEYYGRDKMELASQLLNLSPGSYRFNYAVEGGDEARPAELVWRVTCLSGTTTLLDLSFAPKSLFGEVPTNRFSVPEAGCAGQSLKLFGIPQEFPENKSAIVTRVAIERVSGQ